MNIADKINAQRDVKEMTRRAILILMAVDPDGDETRLLCDEFLTEYGEPVYMKVVPGRV